MIAHIFKSLILLTVFTATTFALSGTGGTPLGGMGTGYVKYSGDKFTVSGKMPPAAADHCKGQAEKQISSSGFHLFAGGTAKSPAKATKEDAKCPLQICEFGTVGGINFTLDAFGPFWPGEGKEKYQLATSPLALFDVTAENSGAAAVEAAVAMEFANGGLLGGANSGTVDGTKAISFTGSENAYLTVDCDGTSPAFSAGAIGTFSTDGSLSNANGNLVAAKCSVPAGGKVHFKFVLAWYRNYDSENYYYHNFYKDSKEAATFGMSKFDSVRDGITTFVDRVTASNFPEWYEDRLLNNTYPLVHNSVCAKDGRTAFWEGNYGIIGTVDQGQHAAVFYSFNWPSVQWHELQYWARQQKSSGQVHHDFNQGTQSFTAGSSGNNRHLKAWDDKTHQDYWWFPNTDSWADLNCMFIFKAHELMLATGDLDSLKKSWSALKKSADRLASQCGGGSKVPEDCHSTYDRCTGPGTGCSYTPEYNGGVAITAFAAMAEIAKFCGETAAATTYDGYSKSMKTAFKQKYGSSSTFGKSASVSGSGRFQESHVAGYAWANYLCLEPIMDEGFITTAVERLRSTQKSSVRGTGEWIFYCVDHYGGAEIAINRPDDGLFVHKQDYDYYYKQVPNQVHWQSLQESSGNKGHDSYMTAPTVWHSYFQFCGYMIDNANKRLWIRPRIPKEMNGKITDAILLNPKGHGTLNYQESETAQGIHVAFDAPGAQVSEFVLKNNTGSNTPAVLINGQASGTVTAEGSGLEKNLRVKLAAPITIGPEGVCISVNGMDCLAVGTAPARPVIKSSLSPKAITSSALAAGHAVHYSADVTGEVKIELLDLNGSLLGTIMRTQVAAGSHSFVWNGRTLSGTVIGNRTVIMRLSTPTGALTKSILLLD